MSEASLEKKIVGAALRSRTAYDKIIGVSDADTSYTPYASQLLKMAGEFYEKDKDVKATDKDVLSAWIGDRITPKNQELYKEYLNQVLGQDISAINIAELVVSTKKRAVGQELAAALLDNKDVNKINGFLEKYQSVAALEGVAETEEESYCNVPVTKMVEQSKDVGSVIRLLPISLDNAVKGRAKRGHHIVLFARPETGKTAETLTMAIGFALQKLPTIIFGNEEPVVDTINRARSCMTDMTYDEIIANPEKAQALLDKRGWEYLRFIPMAPGSPKQIENYVKKYKPACIIVDQIRNLAVGQETRVNQLEMAATSMRNIGKRNDCLVVSITQAGDSGHNKLVLDMGDIDFSNTGIPATADLMVGIGVNTQYDEQGFRMFATPKNKIGGTHTHWQTKINPLLSKMEDM